jgi:hypothetical protein
MNSKHTEIHRTLKVLLWLWFGTITSFAATNFVNIAQLETDNKLIHEKLNNLEKRHLLLKYHTTSN